MKKIIILFVSILTVANSFAQDKAFQKGDFSIGLGAGFAGYGTTATNAYDQLFWNGSAIVTQRVDTTENSGAISAVFPLTLEYGLSNWFGLGARVAYNKYYANGDSTNLNIKPTVYGFDGDLMLNFHFIKTVHFDMPLSIIVGYSGFTYKVNDANKSMAKDNGLNYGFALTPRIIVGKHIGLFVNVGYMGYNYPSMVFSNSTDSNLNDDNNQEFSLKGSGVNLGLGLICKF